MKRRKLAVALVAVSLGGKKGQGPTATLAFLAFLAMWFV